MNVKEAKETSLKKWDLIAETFSTAFFESTKHCGFCSFQIMKPNYNRGSRCYLCRKEFPKISNVCDKMVNLFPDLHEKIGQMITEITDTIRHTEPEGEEEQ